MPNPDVTNKPTEIFGHSYVKIMDDKQLRDSLVSQYCPFIQATCKKPRKSSPEVKIGSCSVGFKGFLASAEPVIICPYRLKTESVFKHILQEFAPASWTGRQVDWVEEVGIGPGGSVDWVAFVNSDAGEEIEDFLCVEFQTAGTTGTPWEAIVELRTHGRLPAENPNYGINWANEFTKTMLQQVIKKGKIHQHWNREIVFVVQDVAMKYFEKNNDMRDMVSGKAGGLIKFCTFSMSWNEASKQWELVPSGIWSTTIEGAERMIGGGLTEDYPSEVTFRESVLRRKNFKES